MATTIIRAPGDDDDTVSSSSASSSGGGVGMVFPARNQFDPKSVLIDYNEKYQSCSPALFRDSEIMQILAVLIGDSKPNPLLIGPAGCGKTKVVEEIARLLAVSDPAVPDLLKGYTIYELPLSALIKGTALVGSMESKLEAIIEFLEDPDNKAICFIDEIHLLQSSNPSYTQVAELLKPALARGCLHLIGSTTLQEANNLTKDPAFNRRFTRIIINELSRKQTIYIVRNYCSHLASHYGHFRLERNLVEYVTDMADSRFSGHRPDTALTLIDRVIASAVIHDPSNVFVQKTDVDRTIDLMHGLADGGFQNSIPNLRSNLRQIKGQDQNLDKICHKIRIHYQGGFPYEKPLSFLFAGNSGTGKTETAKLLARQLFDSKPITLNMTEYRSEAAINRLIGAPAGYVGYDSNREMPFDILQSNPYQLILLDEFEKCHTSVQELFMRILDEGKITNSYGQTIDFSRSIIIATTNAGFCRNEGRTGLLRQAAPDSVSVLSDHINPAILNRFTEILTYADLSKELYKEILLDLYQQESEIYSRFSSNQIPETLDEAALDQIVSETYRTEFGGRPARKAVRDYILNLSFSDAGTAREEQVALNEC